MKLGDTLFNDDFPYFGLINHIVLYREGKDFVRTIAVTGNFGSNRGRVLINSVIWIII